MSDGFLSVAGDVLKREWSDGKDLVAQLDAPELTFLALLSPLVVGLAAVATLAEILKIAVVFAVVGLASPFSGDGS